MFLTRYLAGRFSHLKQYMIQAGMKYSLEDHITNSLVITLIVAIVITILTVIFILKQLSLMIFLVFILTYLLVFYFVVNAPYTTAKSRMRAIESELMFAGKHLLISLRSGVPLYNALSGISTGYGELSKEICKIIELVSVGVPIHEAMKKVAEQTPSQNLRRLLMQLVNSLLFGSEVTTACESIVNEIAKTQEIEMKEYGQKLNPIIIGFMVIGVVFPSIGIAFAIIITTLFPMVLTLINQSLLGAFLLVAGIQIVFLLIVNSQKPQVM